MNTVIYVKTKKELKENAQKLARELGLNLTDVINASLSNFIRTREITFSDVPQMTPELERLIGRVKEDVKMGRNISPKFSDVKKAIEYLHNQ